MNAPFMGNRYLLLNVNGFGHIGELRLHLKDMWKLTAVSRPDEFREHRGSQGLQALDGREPAPAPSAREQTGTQQDAALPMNRRGSAGALPPLTGSEKTRRLRQPQARRQAGGQIMQGDEGEPTPDPPLSTLEETDTQQDVDAAPMRDVIARRNRRRDGNDPLDRTI